MHEHLKRIERNKTKENYVQKEKKNSISTIFSCLI
jgi:hypothetical protein